MGRIRVGRPERAGQERIRRAPHTEIALGGDVGVDHGRADAAVAEELLDGPDVVAVLQ